MQGIGELFPLSDLGHSVLAPALLRWPLDRDATWFRPLIVVLHVGTASDPLLYFDAANSRRPAESFDAGSGAHAVRGARPRSVSVLEGQRDALTSCCAMNPISRSRDSPEADCRGAERRWHWSAEQKKARRGFRRVRAVRSTPEGEEERRKRTSHDALLAAGGKGMFHILAMSGNRAKLSASVCGILERRGDSASDAAPRHDCGGLSRGRPHGVAEGSRCVIGSLSTSSRTPARFRSGCGSTPAFEGNQFSNTVTLPIFLTARSLSAPSSASKSCMRRR